MMKRILCFGDSNTWGADPAGGGRHPQEVRWTGVLQRELGASYQVIEEGYNGRTTVFDDPVERRLSGLTYFYPCLDSQSPLDLIILMLGTNDLKTRFAMDAYSIAQGFQQYLDVLAVCPLCGEKPKVLLAAPIEISPAYRNHPMFCHIFGDAADRRSRAFAPAYEAFAREHGLAFFNAAAYAGASDLDGVHMEPAEHQKLGIAFAAAVRGLLEP